MWGGLKAPGLQLVTSTIPCKLFHLARDKSRLWALLLMIYLEWIKSLTMKYKTEKRVKKNNQAFHNMALTPVIAEMFTGRFRLTSINDVIHSLSEHSMLVLVPTVNRKNKSVHNSCSAGT